MILLNMALLMENMLSCIVTVDREIDTGHMVTSEAHRALDIQVRDTIDLTQAGERFTQLLLCTNRTYQSISQFMEPMEQFITMVNAGILKILLPIIRYLYT